MNAKAASSFPNRDLPHLGAGPGLRKETYAALNADHGKSWSPPVRCATIPSIGAKIWGQRVQQVRVGHGLLMVEVQDPTGRRPMVLAGPKPWLVAFEHEP